MKMMLECSSSQDPDTDGWIDGRMDGSHHVVTFTHADRSMEHNCESLTPPVMTLNSVSPALFCKANCYSKAGSLRQYLPKALDQKTALKRMGAIRGLLGTIRGLLGTIRGLLGTIRSFGPH